MPGMFNAVKTVFTVIMDGMEKMQRATGRDRPAGLGDRRDRSID